MRHHLVVLHKRYLQRMATGRKRVECRLSSIRRIPFQAVDPGDLLWFKLPSGPICGIGVAGACHYHELSEPADLRQIIKPYRDIIQAESDFFLGAEAWSRYLSLIQLETFLAIQPMNVMKSDQRSWVVLEAGPRPMMRINSKSKSV
ncbi:MAG: ASCH domain-containing protein [Phycisphaerae bacterium]|nr:ASCH domain-containing protein [Phycisphaerae bacterium]